ncbi:nuclease, partial [Stenotrophomonas maltophilia]
MGISFLIVAGYAITQNKESLVQASKTRLTSVQPRIIDGDTV